jgi:hypothetical protein
VIKITCELSRYKNHTTLPTPQTCAELPSRAGHFHIIAQYLAITVYTD